MTLQYNVVSHWLITYPEWSLIQLDKGYRLHDPPSQLRDHFMYGIIHWDTALQYNAVSGWAHTQNDPWQLFLPTRKHWDGNPGLFCHESKCVSGNGGVKWGLKNTHSHGVKCYLVFAWKYIWKLRFVKWHVNFPGVNKLTNDSPLCLSNLEIIRRVLWSQCRLRTMCDDLQEKWQQDMEHCMHHPFSIYINNDWWSI